MKIFVRLGVFLLLCTMVLQPVSAAPTMVAQSVSSTTGALQGVVKDDTGAPVSGASVSLRGAQSPSTKTDAKGAFLFENVPAGVYQILVTKPGYQQALESDFPIFANEVDHVAVTLPRVTFTSLRTIATVRATGRGTFNTTPASVNVVSNADFVDQGATGVASVLNEVPGLQISMSDNDTNGAAPGAITYANIRAGLSFETAAEIDGHPLSVGKYGDYVLSFWTPFVFSSFDTIKGPGADAAQTNYAINGTLNMRTLDPTQDFESSFIAGYGSYGDTYFNARWSGTTGRLGFVADLGEVNDESPLNNSQVYIGELPGGYVKGNNFGYGNNLGLAPGTTADLYNNYSLLACCYTVSGSLTKLNELLKLRYRFSSATTATVSYLGSQATSDENGDTLQMTPSIFQPGAGYNPNAGGPALGQQLLISNVYPAPDVETNNEPIVQAELSSTIGNDSVLARYYHASIQRFVQQGNSNPNTPNVEYDTLNGTTDGGVPFSNVYTPVDWYEYFAESENDALDGVDLEYQHPYGQGNVFTASASRTYSTTSFWEAEADTKNYPVVTAGTQDVTIPEGTSQTFTTYRLSDLQNFGSKFNARLSLYQNQYALTAPITCGTGASYKGTGSQCLLNGSNTDFQTSNPSHFDARLGLTYRPTSSLVFRGSAGSSIAPPFAGLMSRFNTIPSCNAPCTEPIFVPQNNPNLRPETAFGYDVGADYRYRGTYFLSGDAYLTNLYNQFISTTNYSGILCTSTAYPTSGCGAPGSGQTPPIYYSINTNLNNARYEGIELTLRHVVDSGIGWLVRGSTQRGYAYDLGSNFYCGFAPSKATPCIPANYNQNLAIIAGENFVGGSTESYVNGSSGVTGGASAAGGVSNQSVPYLQGYAEINWQNPAGWYASFGETLFGKNNSYNEPAFTVARFTVRAPINKSLSLQVAGYNVFRVYSGFYPILGGGVGIPLANGGVAPSLGNVVGPSTYTVQLKDVIGGGNP